MIIHVSFFLLLFVSGCYKLNDTINNVVQHIILYTIDIRKLKKVYKIYILIKQLRIRFIFEEEKKTRKKD